MDLEKSYIQDEKSIIFDCSGAIDFIEQLNIELSLEPNGGVEMHPLDLIREICEIKHIRNIIFAYFYKIVRKIPHISDRNPDLPNRFTTIYCRCYKKFHHSHEPYGKWTYTNLSLQESIKYIKENNLDIQLPRINN